MASIQRQAFINIVAKDAQAACKGTGLFASLMVAQACLESANGTSWLSTRYKNYFGIKASGGWQGQTVIMSTREVVNGKSIMINASFRTYPSRVVGFEDRNRFLKDNPRYTKAGVFTAASPEAQADAFQRAGYATDPNYAKMLKDIIRIYNLKKFD